jgi:outer membrane receptor protein involved in Fe transport
VQDVPPDQREVKVVMTPTPDIQTLRVTATRTTVSPLELPATTVELGRTDLAISAPLTVDDKLRQIPGFTLFRRSGSQTSNPTSQGVSLRGLGASGASRTLVLADGIPLNDPFGGWVHWGLVPGASIERIQVVAGGLSDLYGSHALAGVINIQRRPIVETGLVAEASLGIDGSPLGSVQAGVQLGPWTLDMSAEAFRTPGYIAVRPEDRGTVDTDVDSKRGTGVVRVERLFGDRARIFLQGSLYGEERNNGTRLQTNNTTIRELALGVDWHSLPAGLFTMRLFGGTQGYHQRFSAIATGRNSERLTSDQHVPVEKIGFSTQWSRTRGRLELAAGVDGTSITGESGELLYLAGTPTTLADAGGHQRTVGVFGEALLRLTPQWRLTLSSRVDSWINTAASSTRRPLQSGIVATTLFPDRSQTSFSPRVGLTRQVTDTVMVYAAGYRSFREPTLNELYRSFRVGNTVTSANPNLRAEHFNGGEAGVAAGRLADRIRVRGTLFWGYITDPISNVTLSVTPSLITRQRQNLGTNRSRGFALSADSRITRGLTLSAGYEFADSTVLHFPADPTLEGLRIPQVARHSFSTQLNFVGPGLTFALQGRAVGKEYEDDRNQLGLDPYFVLNAYLARQLGDHVQAFAAVENVFNSRYATGRTPIEALGPPVLLRFGLRFEFRDSGKRRHE